MQYHSLVPLTAALANLLICALVLRHGMRDRLHVAFAGLTLVSASWDLGIFSLCYFTDATSAEWWSRIFRTGICLGPAVVFHFALVLSQSEGPLWRALRIAAYTTGVFLAIANLQGGLVRGLTPHTWGWYVQPTPLYAGLTASLVIFLTLWAERVWRTYRCSTSPRQRVQAKFWLLGAAVQIPFVLTNLLPLYGVNTYPLGNVGNVLFVAILAYAIVRHRLMDVDYVVRKGVSFGLAAVAVLVPIGVGLAALSRVFGAAAPLAFACASVALMLVAVVLVPTLQQALETRVHRALFPAVYDSRLRLRQLAAALGHILDQGELVQKLGDALVDIMDVERCEIFVPDEQTRRLDPAYPTPGAAGSLPEPIAHALERLTEPVLASELGSISPEAAAFFAAQGWEAGLPLHLNDRLTGVIALGRTRHMRIFSSEDLELLATVAVAASVALENARLSRQLRRSEAILERSNRLSSLGMLAAGIAHEIRNPLVAVKTFLDLLPQRLDDPDFLSRFRELSLSELRRVTDLITDLLTLGRSTTAARRVVDLPPTVESVVRLMESTARKRGVELVARFASDLPTIWADPDQLKQITLNLLLNAIEMSPAGTRVTLEIEHAPAHVVLEVRDQGPGIPADQLENIFHPFFTTKETGTGLGLTLVHQMVLEHGGEITANSEVGRGTVFRVTLPTGHAHLAQTGT